MMDSIKEILVIASGMFLTISGKQPLKDYRCRECNKLLFKGMLIDGEVEIKCKNCKNINSFLGEKESGTQ